MQKRAANGRSRGIVFGQSVFVVSAADAANGKRSNCRGYAVQSANVFNAENLPEEELPPMPDLSDPNRSMSPDEIAALFANMGNDNNADKVEEPAEETVEPEDIPEPVEEPEAVKEAPLQPEEPADPNKALSPDEIAALFASMGT